MRHIAAYMLATLGGNEQPSVADVSNILKSVGIKSDSATLEKLVAELSGKNVTSVVAEGMKKMASVPSGAVGTAASAASGAAAVPSAAAEKKEAAKAPAKEESDEEMGFGLFD